MTYRDNEVRFAFEGYSIVSGSYTVSEYSVTDGQDPDGNVYQGLQKKFGADGRILFSVGRKGSSAVAGWFNSRIPAAKNTFGHSTEKLNFAFVGTLVLTLTGGILGGRTQTYTFPGVALAQGHEALRNNWWFGGVDCKNTGSNRVVAKGVVDASNAPMELTFRRGGNSVSEVAIENLVLTDTANWMSKLSPTTRLGEVVMPGSHDAGMSSTSHCAPPVGASALSKTQSVGIAGQLTCGSRYFDIRVDYDYDELVTYHRNGQWGCNGVSLAAVLLDTKKFLETHSSEVVILKFSHVRDDSGHSASDTKVRLNKFLDAYATQLYVSDGRGVNLANIEVGHARGKMILVFDYDEFISPAKGRFRYYDGDSPSGNLTVFDKYSNENVFFEMKSDQVAKWRKHGGLGKGYLFLLSWTLTAQSAFDSSVESYASIANSELADSLYRYTRELNTMPNIVYVDFLDQRIGQTIIQYNFI
jgi:hypothetical protein